MSDTTYVSKTTVITTDWLQKVNDAIYKGRNVNFTTSTSSGNNYSLTLSQPSLYSSVSDGDTFIFSANATNTGAATLTLIGNGSLSSLPLQRNGLALVGGELQQGLLMEVMVKGNTFQLLDTGRIPLVPLTGVTGINTIAASGVGVQSYQEDVILLLYPFATNTANVFISVNGLPPLPIYWNGTICSGGELVNSRPVLLAYDTAGVFHIVGNSSSIPMQRLPGILTTTQSTPWSSRNLRTAATGNTQVLITAGEVAVFNPVTSLSVNLQNPANLTCDISIYGSGGRDQSSAFTNGSMLHFYWIWNGTTLSTISSLAFPSGGPTLPTTYTHYGYIGAIPMNGGNLYSSSIRGDTLFFQSYQAVLSGGSATTETLIDLSSLVPVNSSTVLLNVEQVNSSAAPVTNLVKMRVQSGFDYMLMRCDTQVANVSVSNSTFIEIPSIQQSFYYLYAPGNAATRSFTVNLNGYRMPNGA